MTSFQPRQQRALDVAQPGETVVWTGSAPTGIRFQAMDIFMIPFSLIWTGFALTGAGAAVFSGSGGVSDLFFLPFVVVGIYITVGRFVVDMILRANTSYTLTDRAAYVARTGWFPTVRRYAGSALDSIELQPKSNGSGTILFSANNSMFSWMGSRNGQMSRPMLDRFDSIADAQRVYGLVLAAAKPG